MNILLTNVTYILHPFLDTSSTPFQLKQSMNLQLNLQLYIIDHI